MSDISDFITALEAAQAGKFTPEVQNAAKGIDVATLEIAVAEALAADETEKIAEDSDPKAVALKAGFEFAAKVVMMLKSAPGPFEKKDLYVHFKIGRQEKVPTPGLFDMVVCSLIVGNCIMSSLSLILRLPFYRRSSSTASG